MGSSTSFSVPSRQPEELLTQRHMDLAASFQAVTRAHGAAHDLRVGGADPNPKSLHRGGVGLNCVANGKVLCAGRFKNIWIQPAAGDAGGAVGAALAAYHIHKNQPRKPNGPIDGMKGAYLGPRFDQSDGENRLKSVGGKFETYYGDELLDRTVE